MPFVWGEKLEQCEGTKVPLWHLLAPFVKFALWRLHLAHYPGPFKRDCFFLSNDIYRIKTCC